MRLVKYILLGWLIGTIGAQIVLTIRNELAIKKYRDQVDRFCEKW